VARTDTFHRKESESINEQIDRCATRPPASLLERDGSVSIVAFPSRASTRNRL